MRKCLRCETIMVDDFTVTANGIYVAEVRKEAGVFTRSLGIIKCAVCPVCGYTETYIDNPENINKVAEKNM